MKFLHAADLHLDSPMHGLAAYDGAPVDELRGATRRALVNLVDLALEEQVAFVLIAGDVYDGSWRDFNTGLFYVAQMRRLREAGIPVVAIAGNHDAESRMTKGLPLPDGYIALTSTRPQTVELTELGVVIHGQSFATAPPATPTRTPAS
jgi:exonuclease SbcD